MSEFMFNCRHNEYLSLLFIAHQTVLLSYENNSVGQILICREQEVKFLERIKDVEKTKQQDTLQLQERASNAIKDLEDKMKELRRGT